MNQFTVDESLLKQSKNIALNVINGYKSSSVGSNGPSKAIGNTRDYMGFLENVRLAIEDYKKRISLVTSPYKSNLYLTWDRVNELNTTEFISIALHKREPGGFAQSSPGETPAVKNYKYILREELLDPENPGYKNLVLGKFYDNEISFTCWALTHAESIERSIWFEEFMEQYNWFFVASGTPRVFFMCQEEDFENSNGQRIYGRRLKYWVRTEKLLVVSQKTIENIVINVNTK